MEAAAQAAADRPTQAGQPPVCASHPPRFDISNEESKKAFLSYLDEHGYAVVAAVADEAEVHAAKARFWAAANLTAEDVLNPDAPNCDSLWWPNKRTGTRSSSSAMFKLSLVAARFDLRWCAGIVSGASFNHSDFCWATRLLPRVKEAFSTVRNHDPRS